MEYPTQPVGKSNPISFAISNTAIWKILHMQHKPFLVCYNKDTESTHTEDIRMKMIYKMILVFSLLAILTTAANTIYFYHTRMADLDARTYEHLNTLSSKIVNEIEQYVRLMDYASEETRAIGEKMIEAELNNIPKEKVREVCADHLEKISQGIRDFRF